MQHHKKASILLCTMCVAVICLSRCATNNPSPNDPRGAGFAGADQCRKCHQAVYDAYLASAHYNTTQPATRQNVSGSFANGSNRYSYNDSTHILMEERDSGLYQSAYVNGKPGESYRMDILFGVKHAQTFLYWNANRTYELPVSYYTATKSWGTSPGFSPTNPNFKRFIGANCFECHSSYIGRELTASTAGIDEVLHKNTLVYGIDCERCHGPALSHVNFHADNPSVKEPRYLTRIGTLTRQQKLDICAVCHSGNNKLQEKSTFRFRPGDTLAHFFTLWPTGDTSTNFDVHGNQYQLLSQSACFIKTNDLQCGTCHNPHTNTSNDVKMYSAVCMGCHTGVQHSFAKEPNAIAELKNDCIGCHMPSQPSQAITFFAEGSPEKSAYMLRTHKIGIYKK